MPKGTAGLKIAVFDAETDPFKVNRIPEPFCCGFYDGSLYLEEWGDNCVNALLERVAALDDHYLIYVHNGGKFDFWFMLDWINENKALTIINGRLVEFAMEGTKHVFRDSLAIIPIALSQYQKEEIDYDIFEAALRNRPVNKAHILSYLKSDCLNLFSLVSKFASRFQNDKGNIPISIGQASIRELRELHDFEIMTEASDSEIRPFYMGGRVQCFRAGILKGPWHVYDVNSMYPYVMRAYEHPLSDMWENVDRPPRGKRAIWFAEFEGSNRQAIPTATDSGIDFTVRQGRFFACSHELVPAIASGMVRVDKWLSILKPSEKGSFKEFVDKWYAEKTTAKEEGDTANEIFAKLILNSAYGKTGQNPDDFKDYKILRDPMLDSRLRANGFEPDVRVSEDPFVEIWSRKSEFHNHGFYNVGIAASVTSAARATLLEGLRLSVDPIYCDTDAVICREFKGTIDKYRLGAWDHEATADMAAIAGKKLYCLYDTEHKTGRKYPLASKTNPTGRQGRIYPVKWASKGGDLEPIEIVRIARGGTVEKTAEVPTFSLNRGISFISRNFRKTVANPEIFG
jgi:hypothetical protein